MVILTLGTARVRVAVRSVDVGPGGAVRRSPPDEREDWDGPASSFIRLNKEWPDIGAKVRKLSPGDGFFEGGGAQPVTWIQQIDDWNPVQIPSHFTAGRIVRSRRRL